jgi:hypothetical protein
MNFHKKYKKISPWWRFIRQEFKLLIPHTEKTSIYGYEYEDDLIKITKTGFVTIKENFTFGASGPTIDTKSSRRGSGLHDGIFYISDQGVFKGPNSLAVMHQSNEEIYRLCIEDGMYKWRAKAWFEALELASHNDWESED